MWRGICGHVLRWIDLRPTRIEKTGRGIGASRPRHQDKVTPEVQESWRVFRCVSLAYFRRRELLDEFIVRQRDCIIRSAHLNEPDRHLKSSCAYLFNYDERDAT